MKNKLTFLFAVLLLVITTAAFASTTHYNIALPVVGGSQNTWGTITNSAFGSLDTYVWDASGGTTIGLTSTTTGSTVPLTNPINNVINLSETTTGKNLDMPVMNATASPVVGGTIWVNNIGSNSFGVMAADNSTAIVSSLPAGESVTLQPLTASTTNGTWQVYGPYLGAIGTITLGSSTSANDPAASGQVSTGLNSTTSANVNTAIQGTNIEVVTSTGVAVTGLVSASNAFALTATSGVTAGQNGILSSTPTNALCLETTGATGLCQTNDQGIVIGSPIGGSEGASTINIAGAGYYVNGTIVTNGIRSVTAQIFTTGGTYTPTSGTKYAIVEVVGSGGGGGGSVGCGAGAGGGAGGYARVLETSTQLSSSQSVTIGSAGSGGSAGNNNGSGGATSSFGSLISCTGGGGGGGGAGSNTQVAGGSGGACTVSTGTPIINVAGQTGGGSMSDAFSVSGAGASTPIGIGGTSVGAGNCGLSSIPSNKGTGFGAGGSGASAASSSSAGGNGSAGYVAVTEFQ